MARIFCLVINSRLCKCGRFYWEIFIVLPIFLEFLHRYTSFLETIGLQDLCQLQKRNKTLWHPNSLTSRIRNWTRIASLLMPLNFRDSRWMLQQFHCNFKLFSFNIFLSAPCRQYMFSGAVLFSWWVVDIHIILPAFATWSVGLTELSLIPHLSVRIAKL